MPYKGTFVTGSFCLLLTSLAFADELTPGKYSGRYPAGPSTITITLDIKSVENGTVQGIGERQGTDQSGQRFQRGCIGSFPLKGTAKGDSIDLQAAEKFGGSGAECQFRIRGTVSGNKIVGKIGQNDIELTK